MIRPKTVSGERNLQYTVIIFTIIQQMPHLLPSVPFALWPCPVKTLDPCFQQPTCSAVGMSCKQFEWNGHLALVLKIPNRPTVFGTDISISSFVEIRPASSLSGARWAISHIPAQVIRPCLFFITLLSRKNWDGWPFGWWVRGPVKFTWICLYE